MSTIVKGIYRNGQVHLLETPEGVEEAEVVVTFPDDASSVQDAATREAHRQLLLKRLREHSFDLGGAPYPTRDELHDRGR
jgi:hypothetical protein